MQTAQPDFSTTNTPNMRTLLIANGLENGRFGLGSLAFCTLFGLIDRNEAADAVNAVYGVQQPDISATAQVIRQMAEHGTIGLAQVLIMREFGLIDQRDIDSAFQF